MKCVIAVVGLVLLLPVSPASAQISYSACMSEAYPGMSADHQARVCQYLELKKQQNAWAERVSARILGEQPREEIIITDFTKLRNEFPGDRENLIQSLRPWATALDQARDFKAFDGAATAVVTFIRSFRIKYGFIQSDPGVNEFFGRLDYVDLILRQATSDWRGETTTAARIEYLLSQLAAFPAVMASQTGVYWVDPSSARALYARFGVDSVDGSLNRDPYAHPYVVEWNINKTRQAQAQFASSREETVPAAKQALITLTK
jgi:hypothetical protein